MTDRGKRMIAFFLREIEEGYREIEHAKSDEQETIGQDRITRAEDDLLWEYETASATAASRQQS